MTLPLKIIEDKPLTKEDFQPFRIVSMWAVIEFYAETFLDLSHGLTLLSSIVGISKDLSPGRVVVVPSDLTGLSKCLLNIIDDLEHMNLDASLISAKKLLSLIEASETSVDNDELVKLADELRSRIKDQLTGKPIAMIPAHSLRFVEGTVLGEKMIGALPDLHDEAQEAGNCFALGRYTACTFHLMRIMEYVVHKFADKVKVTFDEDKDTWGTILERVRLKLEKWPKSKEKDKYSACYKSMDGLRPRRNSIMHHGEHYSPERAEFVIGAVKSCLEQYLDLPEPLEGKE